MKICEVCGKEHDGSYGSGRFCSKHCRAVRNGRITAQNKRENGTLESSMAKTRTGIKYKQQPVVNSQPGGKCKFCGKECKNRNSLVNHERCCKENPKRYVNSHSAWNKGHTSWNKGLTKETSNIIAKQCEMIKHRYASGELISSWKGKHHTEEQKQKISEKMKLVYTGRSRWFTQIEKRKSYAEQYFEKIFITAKRNYHVDRYFLDFAWPDKKTYIEVDGEQHYNDIKVIEHDIERTKRLNECGWTLLARIRWSAFKKLNEDEKRSYVSCLCEKI